MTHVEEAHRDMVATALATMRQAEDDYVLGKISRRQFDAIAGGNVMVLAGAAERCLDDWGRRAMRPETLEQALTWLIADVNGVVSSWTNIDGNRVVSAVGEVSHPNGPRHPHGMAVAKPGDIPAAIIAATQQVWDQINAPVSGTT